MTTATALLAPDPALPSRDALLDDREMPERLSELLGAGGAAPIDRYARGRVKYKVGHSLRVVHELEVDGEPRLVASRTFAGGRSESVFERAAHGAPAAGPLRAVAHDPDLQTVFWTFPHDRKIATLAALGSGTGTVTRLLGRPVGATVLAAYAPEKSATAACFDLARRRVLAYAKVYAAAGEALHARGVHLELARRLGSAHPALRLPHALAYGEPERMLLVGALSGRRIDALSGDELDDTMHRFGAGLAALHGLPAPDGLPPFVRLAPARQPHAAELISRARPDVGFTARRLAHELAAGAPHDDAPPVCLHGDAHPKNGVLGDDGVVALIDLDQAGLGPAAADLGSVIAGLRARALADGEEAAARRQAHRLLDGYASGRALPAAGVLRWHVAAALLSERALRAVNRIRPDGLAHLEGTLLEARAVLRGEDAW